MYASNLINMEKQNSNIRVNTEAIKKMLNITNIKVKDKKEVKSRRIIYIKLQLNIEVKLEI